MIDDADGEVYEKYADDLLRFASMLVGPSNADDVVAGAVLRVVTSTAWSGVRDHRGYLFRAVLYQARSEHRSTQRRLAREIRAGIDRPTVPSLVRVEVLDALRRLSVRQRAVIFFRFWEDLNPEEIAEILGVSIRTIQRDLETAQRRLEVLLQ